MKKNRNQLFCMIITLILFLTGCKREEKAQPLEKNTTPPGVISNIKIINKPGRAEISYILPKDRDLLYVKAVYSLANGKPAEVKASYYDNGLTVDGFGDTTLHEITLYAVNRSEVSSSAVSVMVKPLENPIWGVFRSLKAVADFAGLKFTANNPTKADLAIEVLVESKGKYVPTSKNIYTSAVDIEQSIRGLDTIPQKFGITIRDRWLNYTDTMFATFKPLYEAVIPKSGYRAVNLPTDIDQEYGNQGTSIAKMWDGDNFYWPNLSMTKLSVLSPQWVTFDIGRLATLSRIVIWDYPEYLNDRTYYYGGDLKDFEIWGTDDPPSDGSFNNWVLLGSFHSKKPSGTAYGINTNEDYATANAGLSYNFSVGLKKVRYLRIKSIKNWQGTSFQSIAEIQVYGDPR